MDLGLHERVNGQEGKSIAGGNPFLISNPALSELGCSESRPQSLSQTESIELDEVRRFAAPSYSPTSVTLNAMPLGGMEACLGNRSISSYILMTTLQFFNLYWINGLKFLVFTPRTWGMLLSQYLCAKKKEKKEKEEKEGNIITITFLLSLSYFTCIVCKMTLHSLE